MSVENHYLIQLTKAWYPKADRVYTSDNPLDANAYGVAPLKRIILLNLMLLVELILTKII